MWEGRTVLVARLKPSGGCTCANGAGANHNQVSTVTLLLCVEEATPTATAVQLPAKSESMKQRVALAQTCTPATTAVLPKYNTESCNTVSRLAIERRGVLSTSRLPLLHNITTKLHACLLGMPLGRPSALAFLAQAPTSTTQHMRAMRARNLSCHTRAGLPLTARHYKNTSKPHPSSSPQHALGLRLKAT